MRFFFICGQRLRKYHSVPGLRLVPSSRPLFFCDNCCSANFYVPVCLWCKWTSPMAMRSFEEKTPRGRTMSAPRLCSAGPECVTERGGSKGGAILERLGPRGSLDSDRSTAPPETPRSQSRDNNSPAIASLDEWISLSADEATLVCRIFSTGPVLNPNLTFSPPSSSQPSAFPQLSPDPYHRGRVRNRKQRPSAVCNNRNSLISFSRSARTPWNDDELGNDSRSFFSDEPQEFRGSPDSRYSGTKSEGYVSRPALNPPKTRQTATQPSLPSPCLTRRPLYHHIRSKPVTSRSTFDCGVVPEITPKQHINTQQDASHRARQSVKEFPATVHEPRFSTPIPPIMSFSGKGFSLSGETEQRMNLARVVHDGRFVFHESKPRKRDRIMRGLRRSFKSFFGPQGVDR